MKRLKSKSGSASFGFFVVLFCLATIVFMLFFLNGPQSLTEQKNFKAPDDEKIQKLEGEIFQLYTSMADAERMRDREKYLEILNVVDVKLVEVDRLWDLRMQTKRGLFDGMIGGMAENYEARFTREDKLEMLSNKYSLPKEKIALLKADLEAVFSDEWLEKYSHSLESTEHTEEE